MNATIEDVCTVAIADGFRGDGELLATPIGALPTRAVRLAQATSEPGLMVTDGRAHLVTSETGATEAWMPFRTVFDAAWSGRRHVVMGAAQIDRFGNQNIAAIGDWRRPHAQLLGLRGAPGNAINHAVTYWIPDHSPRVFVEAVDIVCAPGYDRAAALGPRGRFVDIRRVVTNLAVLDFATPDRRMRLVSTHPGVTVADVVAATGFDLMLPVTTPETRAPNVDEAAFLARVPPTA